MGQGRIRIITLKQPPTSKSEAVLSVILFKIHLDLSKILCYHIPRITDICICPKNTGTQPEKQNRSEKGYETERREEEP